MKTITYNPETHVLVPREPNSVMVNRAQAKANTAGMWINYKKLELFIAEAISAAPQPEPVESEPIAWWNGKETVFFEHEVDGPVGEVRIPLYATPQPDRTAELESETTKLKLDLLTSYGESEELSGKVAELEAALKVAREALEFYSDPHVAGQPATARKAITKINEVLK